VAKRGLAIGKFYPPHRGHKYLIDTAESQTDELWVIVCGKPEEQPSGELRAAWLRDIHPQANILLIEDKYDQEDSKLWAELTLGWLGFTPDVVFTSEDYGTHYTRYLGCQHVQVDKARQIFPISGTEVRNNPYACWQYLEPPVRAYYAKRICLVGAESTGKTTLALALAEHFQTVWVEEYGREFSERKLAEDGCYIWNSEEFAHIAEKQCELENARAREANRVLICDTDAFATSIWHRRYVGGRSPEVEQIAADHRHPDIYLLPDVNTPFVQDGTRDGEQIREWMHATFIEELSRHNRPFRLLSGSFEERLRQAISYIEQLLNT
jgi:NadR type nicotinamide-nucleotide adenylyltransferase